MPDRAVRAGPAAAGRSGAPGARLERGRRAILLPDGEQDQAFVLYDLTDGLSVRARMSFTGPDGSLAPVPVPGWEDREVPPLTFVPGTDGSAWLAAVEPSSGTGGAGCWRSTRRTICCDGADPFTFGHLFCQRLLVELRGLDGDVPVAGSETSLLVCDLRRCGSLYARLLDRLVAPDTERQATEAGVPNPGAAYHPWFPVLEIGSDKAALYTRALVHDIAGDGQHLSDPGWLMRVGLYLEFLTFLGICEAVKDDVGDLLSPAERAAFEQREWFAEIRESIDAGAWRDGVGAEPHPVPAARDAADWSRLGAQPARQEEGDAALPARPPRRPQARDPAGRSQPPQRAGDLAARVPRRRAGGPAQRRRRVPGARLRVADRRATSSSGTARVASRSAARCACPAPSAACSPIRTACSAPPARSTATR